MKDGYYWARKNSLLNILPQEPVEVKKGYVYRCGIQQGYTIDEFKFYKRLS